MNQNELIQEFIDRLGDPFDVQMLIEYLKYCGTEFLLEEESIYSELHHILPRSVFPEFENLQISPWNGRHLPYLNHVEAHTLLAAAYPIPEFCNPLRFMPVADKLKVLVHQALSERNKKFWLNFKTNHKKYDEWRQRKSEFMKAQMTPGTIYYTKMCQCSSERFKKQEERDVVSKQFIALWENDDYRENSISKMIQLWTPERKKSHREAVYLRWQDADYRNRLTKKLILTNTNIEKRQDASKKLKSLWRTSEYRNNVAVGRKNAIRRSSSEAMKTKWQDPIWRQFMLDARIKRGKL